MERITNYVILKRCCNCQTLNEKKANSCHFCGLMLFKEVEKCTRKYTEK